MLKKLLYLVISIITIGFGFISHNTTSFDVPMENIQVLDKSNDFVIEETKDGINYDIELNKPGDFYSFTVDLVNKGNVDAKIAALKIGNLTDNQKRYLEYNATYLDGREIKVNDIIKAKSKNTIKVTIYFKEDIESFDLPQEDEVIDLGLNINIKQAD